jgi:hypothetical protein
MAQTWTAYHSGVAFAATKVMGGVYNNHASEVLKIRRVGLLNGQTAGVTGVVCSLEMRSCTVTTWSAPTSVTPTTHDSTNSAPTTYTSGNGGTLTAATGPFTFRRTIWSSDEAKLTTLTNNELECFVPLNILFDAGYGDANVQPMTLRQTWMGYVWNVSGAAGLLDVWIEFTKE